MKLETITRNTIEMYKKLWPFRCYMLSNLIFISFVIYQTFDSLEENLPILNFKPVKDERIIGKSIHTNSIQALLWLGFLLFIFATNDLRSHYSAARLIFLLPLLSGMAYALKDMFDRLLDKLLP